MVTGFPDGTYRPKDDVTRAQLVNMLWMLEGHPGGSGPNPYSDTRPGAFYQPALDWAAETGEIELGLSLAIALEQFWVAAGPYEGARRVQAFLDRAADLFIGKSCGCDEDVEDAVAI